MISPYRENCNYSSLGRVWLNIGAVLHIWEQRDMIKMTRKWSYGRASSSRHPQPTPGRAVFSPWWIWEPLESCHCCPAMGNQLSLQGVSGEVRCCLPVPGMSYQESLLPGAAPLVYEGWDESAERKAVNGCRKEWLHHLPGGWATRVTSWLCKNWATFGQGGEVLAKAFSLLIDPYLLHEGKTSVRRSVQHLGGHDCLLRNQWSFIY